MAASAKENPGSAGESTFEESLLAVEKIVAQLEAGDKPLDETLALYEQAVASLRRCHSVLDSAEKRILHLRSVNGQPALEEAPVAQASGLRRDPEDRATARDSLKQNVDATPAAGQNAPPTVTNLKSGAVPGPHPANHGKKPGGGSLFGSAQ